MPDKDYFPRVTEAREALKAESLALVELYRQAVAGALAAEEWEVAIKATQWLMEHSPSHEGVTILDSGVDVVKTDKGNKAPQIQIGIKLGHQGNIGSNNASGFNRALPSGMNKPQAIPADIQVIDITPDE